MNTKVTKAIVLVEIEWGTVHQVFMPADQLLNYLRAYSNMVGTLPIGEAMVGFELIQNPKKNEEVENG